MTQPETSPAPIGASSIGKHGSQVGKWKFVCGPFGGGNYLLERDGFSVSYNPNTRAIGFPGFSGDCAEETALIIGGRYLILNGDFRAAYEAARNRSDALAIFDANKAEHRSSWSEE